MLCNCATYFVHVLWVKLKFVLSRGKSSRELSDKIPLLIFAESKRYWQVFRPICEELSRRGIDVAYWTTSQDDPAFKSDLKRFRPEFVGEGNKAYAKLNMVSAYVVVSSTPGLGVYQWKRSKLVDYYIHVIHAANEIALYRMFGLDFYDAVLLSGQYQIDELRELEEKRYLPQKELVLAGIPYMDAMREKILTVAPRQHSDKCVLLAPSWGPNSILCKYGEKIIEALKETGFRIIVRPHPQSFTADKEVLDRLMTKYPETENFQWNRDNDNFDVLDCSDIMITDFSGVIYDFTLVFDKPIIYADTSFDHSPYDSAWIDDTLWKFTIIPKLGRPLKEEDFPNMAGIIRDVVNDTAFAEGREQARRDAWVYPGEAAVRTTDYLLAKKKQLPEIRAGKK